jgi:Immunoglobulin-like domain of bacterial spore germination
MTAASATTATTNAGRDPKCRTRQAFRPCAPPFLSGNITQTTVDRMVCDVNRIGPGLLVAVLLGACGSDDNGSTGSSDATPSTTSSGTAPTTQPEMTLPVTTLPVTTPPTTAAATTTPPVSLEQPAIWPAAAVVFATPDEAAADFVRSALGVDPVLGEFQGGDSRSGEIEVFSPGEGSPVLRGVLFLRQLGPDDGWFVIGAANPNASITAPAANAEVAAGLIVVEGVARGFEATVIVTAFVAGDDDALVDQEITMGGAFETPEPFSVSLDLVGVPPGTAITLLVRGDTGLETDPGEFGAIAIVITE